LRCKGIEFYELILSRITQIDSNFTNAISEKIRVIGFN